jgi:hypothetical protein
METGRVLRVHHRYALLILPSSAAEDFGESWRSRFDLIAAEITLSHRRWRSRFNVIDRPHQGSKDPQCAIGRDASSPVPADETSGIGPASVVMGNNTHGIWRE